MNGNKHLKRVKIQEEREGNSLVKSSRGKKLPIGIENFEKIRTENFYYIDKSMIIKELLDNWGEVNLFTRPRRFGKTLNMSMLKAFFEIDCRKELFKGLKIEDEGEICQKYMGQFSVISITLKGVKGEDYFTARSMMAFVIGMEAMRFQFLRESEKLTEWEKKLYGQLTVVDETNQEGFLMPDAVLMESIKTLSVLLQKHYRKRVLC